MGPWAFGVPIVLVSCVGLLLNAYILLVVLGLGKQVNLFLIFKFYFMAIFHNPTAGAVKQCKS